MVNSFQCCALLPHEVFLDPRAIRSLHCRETYNNQPLHVLILPDPMSTLWYCFIPTHIISISYACNIQNSLALLRIYWLHSFCNELAILTNVYSTKNLNLDQVNGFKCFILSSIFLNICYLLKIHYVIKRARGLPNLPFASARPVNYSCSSPFLMSTSVLCICVSAVNQKAIRQTCSWWTSFI